MISVTGIICNAILLPNKMLSCLSMFKSTEYKY